MRPCIITAEISAKQYLAKGSAEMLRRKDTKGSKDAHLQLSLLQETDHEERHCACADIEYIEQNFKFRKIA